ncbi:MAG: OmpA family protein [Bacteroidales bacterium]
MKTIFSTILVLMLGFTTAFSQSAEKQWALGLGYGTYQYKGELRNQFFDFGEWQSALNVHLAKYLSPSFNVRGEIGWGEFDVTSEHASTTYMSSSWPDGGYIRGGLDLVYKLNNGYIFNEDSWFQPYLLAGPGISLWNINNGYAAGVQVKQFEVEAGGGIKFKFSPVVSAFAEVSRIWTFSDDLDIIDNDNYGGSSNGKGDDKLLKMEVGLAFALGNSKDTDGDGVGDNKDKCPGTPEGVEVDKTGCPKDTDGDGVADYQDECPNEAGTSQTQGCPDRDGDGVADKDDQCPDEAGLARFNGCPDSDGDGVADSKDKCPDTPKGVKVDASGCPADSDGDGIPDHEDNCPNQAGPKSNSGCPEKAEVTPTAPTSSAVLFDLNRATIHSSSNAQLNTLAEYLKANSGAKIEIDGHACDLGTISYNDGLSKRRAEAVKKYLISKGVSASQIEVKWFGESKPAYPNTSEANRAKNRRVEFINK